MAERSEEAVEEAEVDVVVVVVVVGGVEGLSVSVDTTAVGSDDHQ